MVASFEDSLTELYKKLIEEGSMLSLSREEAEGIKNVCSAGCGYCCFQSIEVFNFEIFVILHYLKKTNKLNFLKDAKEASLRIQKELPAIPFKDDPADEDLRDILNFKLQYRSLNMPCIFLHEGKCSIYEVRPINCSTYFSYGEKESCGRGLLPPEQCTSNEDAEQYILSKLLDFIDENDYAWELDPFGIDLLPIGIDNYK